MTTAEIIKTARTRRGLSMKQLSEKSEISKQSIWNIEKGKVSPTMDTMLTLMRAMDYELVFKPKYKGGYYDE